MPFFAVQANDQVMKTRNLNRFFFSSCEFMTFLQFERKETFTMTSYPEAVDHVNDFDEMLHFIIKATASTRATIIHTIITEKSCLQKNEMHKHIMRDDFMQSRKNFEYSFSNRNRRARFFIGPRFLRLLSISNFVICSRYSLSYFFQFGLLSNIVKWKKIVKCVLHTVIQYLSTF